MIAGQTTYPQRASHHAHRLTRLLFKSCACQEIGSHAVLLVIHIAHTEDAVRYQYPVRFWNGQLMALFGWNSPKQLTEARRRAVEAGWLHYEREGNRQVGRYWTLIPKHVEAFDDGPIETPVNHSENGTNSGTIPGTNGRNVSENGTIPGTNSGTIPGMIPGTNSGKHSNPIPNPIPVPTSRPGHVPDPPTGKASKKRLPTFTEADKATADWIWDAIRTMQPTRKRPDLAKWANVVRVMREQDGRTDEQIRALFKRVQADAFWCTNVLCPEKLREKWDDLQLKLRTNGKPTASPYPELTPPRR